MNTKQWLLFLLLIVCFQSNGFGQTQTKTVFLVRHAEKAEDIAGDRDPPLNELGLARAKKLAQVLIDSDIKYIYSTNFKRTRNTGLPLAESLRKEITTYDSREPGVLGKIISETGNDRVLIIGHSNTIPAMVNELIGEEKYPLLKEEEYDNLFIVSFSEEQADCIVIKY